MDHLKGELQQHLMDKYGATDVTVKVKTIGMQFIVYQKDEVTISGMLSEDQVYEMVGVDSDILGIDEKKETVEEVQEDVVIEELPEEEEFDDVPLEDHEPVVEELENKDETEEVE